MSFGSLIINSPSSDQHKMEAARHRQLQLLSSQVARTMALVRHRCAIDDPPILCNTFHQRWRSHPTTHADHNSMQA